MTYVMLLGGLVLLIGGAEVIVRYGTRLSRRLGISPLIIGLTIVSIGTSAPELAAGVRAMTAGSGNLLVGNVTGSNLMNLLLILGIAAAIRPISLQRQAVRLDLPAMVAATVLTLIFSLDGSLAVWEGAVLLTFAVTYTAVLIVQAKREASAEHLADVVAHDPEHEIPVPVPGVKYAVADVVLLVAGIATVVLGADLLVAAATELAERFGVSDSLIGLTIVAIGTSLPELATTTMATIRGARSLAVGNLLGSSTYNLTLILGTSLLFAPGRFALETQLLHVDLPVLVVGALVCVPVFLTGREVSRREGWFFIGLYGTYLTYVLTLRG